MQVRIWAPLKGIVKIYGMSKFGVISGIFGGLIAIILIDITWSVPGAIPGYFAGDYLAKALHDGRAQRIIRWYLGNIRKSKTTPDTSIKMFF